MPNRISTIKIAMLAAASILTYHHLSPLLLGSPNASYADFLWAKAESAPQTLVRTYGTDVGLHHGAMFVTATALACLGHSLVEARALRGHRLETVTARGEEA